MKLGKKSSEASSKGLDEEDYDKEFNYHEESKDECKVKKDRSLGLMPIKRIQSLIANIVKAQLRGRSCKPHLYKALHEED